MSYNWFYADSQNKQKGPLEESSLVNAYERGEVSPTTLVWREGLPSWVPFSHVAGKFGITTPSAPPRLPLSSNVQIVKSGKSSSWIIVLVVCIFGFIMVFGILAAIAIPAYQDYTIRAKVMTARMRGAELKLGVQEFYEQQKRCPNNGEGGIQKADSYATQFVSAITVGALTDGGNCAIQITLRNININVPDGGVLQMAMAADGTWSETSNLPAKYLPASMRR